ncbi:MAG: excinuclease ABC subunit UvrA [Lentisphaerae bacterium]|nr:excinuclease ABC subunit UvrA [Lentisphaerota bacterium]
MNNRSIIISGAREHNLKNVSVTIPANRMVVVTGLSGSGKSSLAFDTLYAEGRRKYVESLSAYARQFLEQMHKPDVDHIEGLSPAIAIEQRTAGANPRSTVATTTEIHDYLRLLFSNIGKQHCTKCKKPVAGQTVDEIVELILQHPEKTRLILLAPLVTGKKGRHEDVFEHARKLGFVRMRVNGKLYDIDDLPELDKKKQHSIDVVVDRLVITDKIKSRLTGSSELALKEGNGIMNVIHEIDGKQTETLYSEKHACATCGLSFDHLTPRHFSFNSPHGACPTCSGLGMKLVFDESLLVPNPELSINKGAIHAWRRGGRRMIIYYNRILRSLSEHYQFDLATPFKDLPANIKNILFYGSKDEDIEFGFWRGGAHRKYEKPFEGIIPNLTRRLDETESETVRKRLRNYMNRMLCPDCGGSRLKKETLACLIDNKSIADITASSVDKAERFFANLSLSEQDLNIAKEVIKEIRTRLGFLKNVGLGYLTLDRESGTLSGGEAQRIRLATQIGSGLVGVLYVLDEPSIGLHHRDNQRLIETLKRLRDTGNTVVVVEHDVDTIMEADFVIDLGPGAGHEGGRLVFAGKPNELLACKESLTGQYLNDTKRIEIPNKRKAESQDKLVICTASENNLKNITVPIPLGLLVCVTGVSGSGKSTLVDDILRRAMFRHFYDSKEIPGKHEKITGIKKLDKVIVIDQSPIGRTPRSNPATYTGAFTLIRDLFAKLPASNMKGFNPGRFSFNVKGGRCERCKGDGIIKIEMHFLPDVYVACEQCRGKRYNSETLEIKYAGKNIADVLQMTIDEALTFFDKIPTLSRKLSTLSEIGLGYVQLGQAATTLSGGEAQRMKLSAELSKRSTGKTLYILDEPTTGLHFADIEKLLAALMRLRDAGNTVVVVEHNPEIIKTADYIIDLGPEGGDAGGHLVVAGTPENVAKCRKSHTGAMLKDILAKDRRVKKKSDKLRLGPDRRLSIST